MRDILLLIILPLSLAISFLCAGMESGLFSLSRWRIRQQMRAGNKRAALLNHYLENSENLIWTILVGNTLAAFTAIAIVAVFLLGHFAGHALLASSTFIGAVFLFYIFCDLLPKMLFRLFPNRLSMFMATPFRLLHLVLSPFVAVVEGLAGVLLIWTGGKVYTGHVFTNRQELRLFMRDTAQELTSDEKTMINRVLDLQMFTVRQLLIGFQQAPGLDPSSKMADAIALFRQMPQNTIPVWTPEGKSRRVAGVLNLKSFLFNPEVRPDDPVTQHLSSVLYISEDTPVEQALRRMQKTGQRLAVILGRNRQELGVVTLETVLRVIFGEVKL
jgi:CBS domain containing-hemolysin-like protein